MGSGKWEMGKWADKSQVNSRQAEAMQQKVAATGAVAFSISLKWKIFCKYFRVFLVLVLLRCFSLISFCLLWHCLRSCYFCKAVSLFSRPPPLDSGPLSVLYFYKYFV